MLTATIFDIQRNSFVDGPGIRTTVFFKGCNLNCEWCHNPEGKAAKPQLMFYKNLCSACGNCIGVCQNANNCVLCGKCALFCPNNAKQICGKVVTVDELLNEILKDKPYYKNSGGGVTFSGGEAMLQIDFLLEILKACKQNGIHTAVDTAGHLPYLNFEKILPYTDLFLYDIKVFNKEKHKKHVGVDNELILQNLEKLFKANAKVIIRIPIVSGFNDTKEEMQQIKDFLNKNAKEVKVELLPYHAMGLQKAAAIGEEIKEFLPISNEKLEELKAIFKNT